MSIPVGHNGITHAILYAGVALVGIGAVLHWASRRRSSRRAR